MGFRWVRSEDPDGIHHSSHPKAPCKVTVAKTRHPLCGTLKDMDLPEDEIYIDLEQVCPAMTLMETSIEKGSFPQCAENETPWGGTIINFIPGHSAATVQKKEFLENIEVLISYLL